MFILGPLSPLHYPSGDRLTIRIDELPIASELCRRHPLWQWFGRASFDISVRLNYRDYFLRRAFEDVSDSCLQVQVFVEHGGNRLVQLMCHSKIVRKHLGI